ncbi:hypothetical protein [Paenibacillus elgii]|uniref:hypothetical protein n=1 Tax=Paenibacillus elgii TaxID=189691 RepID=UPI0013D65B93|nr:hypothetical protein [Paenibacillus elgii]
MVPNGSTQLGKHVALSLAIGHHFLSIPNSIAQLDRYFGRRHLCTSVLLFDAGHQLSARDAPTGIQKLDSWIPFRFVSSGLKTVLYFGGINMSRSYQALGWLAVICLFTNKSSLYWNAVDQLSK